jgi:hypothetical protein
MEIFLQILEISTRNFIWLFLSVSLIPALVFIEKGRGPLIFDNF